jgi:hypothetical protein
MDAGLGGASSGGAGQWEPDKGPDDLLALVDGGLLQLLHVRLSAPCVYHTNDMLIVLLLYVCSLSERVDIWLELRPDPNATPEEVAVRKERVGLLPSSFPPSFLHDTSC